MSVPHTQVRDNVRIIQNCKTNYEFDTAIASKPLHTTGDIYHNWNIWKNEFELFAIATKLSLQPQDVQAATFLMAIREEARRVFLTYKFENEEQKKYLQVLTQKFEDHHKLVTNLTFNGFRFGSRDQLAGKSLTIGSQS